MPAKIPFRETVCRILAIRPWPCNYPASNTGAGRGLASAASPPERIADDEIDAAHREECGPQPFAPDPRQAADLDSRARWATDLDIDELLLQHMAQQPLGGIAKEGEVI